MTRVSYPPLTDADAEQSFELGACALCKAPTVLAVTKAGTVLTMEPTPVRDGIATLHSYGDTLRATLALGLPRPSGPTYRYHYAHCAYYRAAEKRDTKGK